MSKVQKHYDEVAEIYDRRYDREQGRQYYDHISRQVLGCLKEGAFILDIGCGTGLFMERYLSRGGAAVGIDISRGMIRRARDRCPMSEFVVGDGQSLPFAGGTFDAVASLLAFSYVREPERMLSEVFRVLKPGGRLALCTLGRNMLTSMVPALYRIGELIEVKGIGVGDFGERYYTEEEMMALLEGAGFCGVTVRRCSFAHVAMVKPFFRIARRMEPFVEERVPRLAYNVCASGIRPHR